MIPLLILALAICLPGLAQSSQSVPAKRKYNYPGKIESTYDKSKDETMVFFRLMPISAGRNLDWEGLTVVSDERLDVSMYFTYPGQKLATPKWVGMGIKSSIYEPKQYGDYTLTIVRDNHAINVGRMTVHKRGEIRISPQRPTVKIQLLEASIPYEEFLSIANAKKVKLRIGHREFPLDPENLEAIRDLASRTAP